MKFLMGSLEQGSRNRKNRRGRERGKEREGVTHGGHK